MPETIDPLTSLGYLVAAAGVTVVGLLGYGIAVARRLAGERARSRELRREEERASRDAATTR